MRLLTEILFLFPHIGKTFSLIQKEVEKCMDIKYMLYIKKEIKITKSKNNVGTFFLTNKSLLTVETFFLSIFRPFLIIKFSSYILIK